MLAQRCIGTPSRSAPGDNLRQVEVAVLNGAPSVSDALAAISQPIIRVVPFFMEERLFQPGRGAAGDWRRDVRDADNRAGSFCVPRSGSMTAWPGSSSAGRWPPAAIAPFPRATPRFWSPAMGLPVSPAELWHCIGTPPVSPATDLSLGVEAACLEEPPFVADALHGLRAHPVVVIGFFANQGGHVRDDVPALIAAEQAGRGRRWALRCNFMDRRHRRSGDRADHSGSGDLREETKMFAYVGSYTTPGPGRTRQRHQRLSASIRSAAVGATSSTVGGLENPSLFTLNRDG